MEVHRFIRTGTVRVAGHLLVEAQLDVQSRVSIDRTHDTEIDKIRAKAKILNLLYSEVRTGIDEALNILKEVPHQCSNPDGGKRVIRAMKKLREIRDNTEAEI